MSDEPFLPPDVWDAAVDPEMPPGVIEIQLADGCRYRYPLIEYMVD